MENQITTNYNALKLFFTDDVFLVKDDAVEIDAQVDSVSIESKEVLRTENSAVEEAKPYQLPEIPVVAEEPKTALNFEFLGGNKKSVLILVNDTEFPVSSPQGRELLRKIVKAIDLSTPDFALVNYSKYKGVNFDQLSAFFKPNLMLAFGVTPADLALNLNVTGEILQHPNTKIIFAPNLHPLDADIAQKKSLWANLKKI
jgi:DNA polymerase III psi subunit